MDRLGGDGSCDGDVERRGAGRGRGRGSWAPMPPNRREFQMLRRPYHSMSGVQTAGSTESKSTEQGKPDKSHDDIIKNSTLSVHAAEFIPKCYPAEQTLQQQQQQRQQGPARYMHKHSIQDRLQLARETPNNMQQHQAAADRNIPHYGYYEGGAGDCKDRSQESNEAKEIYKLDFSSTTQQLLNIVHSLILNPGRFTSVVPPLINNLRPYLEFPSQFRGIVGIIIQQSINEGNFRYSGARLCASLDTAITSNEQMSFRETLYILCKEETDTQIADWQQRNEHGEDKEKKCHGLILFLAELVTQMESTPTFDLGEILIQLITVVLKKPAPNSVKHICQALKLAGQTLEKDKRENRKEMENMMRALTELVTQGRVDSHVGRMVHSVHELRNGNWGQGTSSVESTTNETIELIEQNQALDEPVLYGPDGKILSAEENKFLEDLADSATNIEDHDLSDLGYGDGSKWFSDDDDEFDAAYEEFLEYLPKKIENKAQE